MIYRDVKTLKLAFSWDVDFITSNGIEKIPDWWAFAIETCGILSWVVMFVFAISMFVGYSRQMSSFYFLYEQMTGKKLSNPYKPAFLFFLLWCSLYVVSGTFTIAGVYFLKYGYIYGALAAFLGFSLLATILFVAFRVSDGGDVFFNTKFKGYSQAQRQSQNHNAIHVIETNSGSNEAQYSPAYAKVDQKNNSTLKVENKKPISQNTGSKTGNNTQVALVSDPIFEEALSILDLERGFTKAELKKRYHDLAKKFHSDKGGTSGLYFKIKACYEYLIPFAK